MPFCYYLTRVSYCVIPLFCFCDVSDANATNQNSSYNVTAFQNVLAPVHCFYFQNGCLEWIFLEIERKVLVKQYFDVAVFLQGRGVCLLDFVSSYQCNADERFCRCGKKPSAKRIILVVIRAKLNKTKIFILFSHEIFISSS